MPKLDLVIKEAKNLDYEGKPPNCYIKYEWAGEKVKTEVVEGENPRWNESSTIKFKDEELLVFDVCHSKRAGNVCFGRVGIGLTGLREGATSDGWYRIDGASGKVRLQLTLQEEHSEKPKRKKGGKKQDDAPRNSKSRKRQQLKNHVPDASDDEIEKALEKNDWNVDDALEDLLKTNQKDDERVTKLANMFEDLEGGELDEKGEELLEEVKKIFPQTPVAKIISAIKQCGGDRDATIDFLLDYQVTLLSMTEQALSLKMSATQMLEKLDDKMGIKETFTNYVNEHEDEVKSSKFRPKEKLGTHAAEFVSNDPDNFVKHSGIKKALLIGINYFGTNAELSGCINDVKRIRKLITGVYGFPDDPRTITTLTDDSRDSRYQPTRNNIIKAIRWLVGGSKRGDVLFFHFSGHGSQQKENSKNSDERNGLDETILPVDYTKTGHIIDDELNAELVGSLPEGVKLTVFMDCCHSGTGLDLSYVMDSRNKWKTEATPKYVPCDVQLISGCDDHQTSADLQHPSFGAGGAMSMAMIQTLTADPFEYTYFELLDELRKVLASKGFTQIPQLTSSQQFTLAREFSFDEIVPNTNSEIGRSEPRKKKRSAPEGDTPPPPPPQHGRGRKGRHGRKEVDVKDDSGSESASASSDDEPTKGGEGGRRGRLGRRNKA